MTPVRYALLLVVLVGVSMLIITLLPGEPCAEFNGWRWVWIWPRPDHCH